MIQADGELDRQEFRAVGEGEVNAGLCFSEPQKGRFRFFIDVPFFYFIMHIMIDLLTFRLND